MAADPCHPQVTARLRSRLDAALDSMVVLERPLETLEAALPHLDGTPLEDEPCVGLYYYTTFLRFDYTYAIIQLYCDNEIGSVVAPAISKFY